MNNKIIFAEKNSSREESKEVIDGILRLRHETFIDRLEWDISSTNGREHDQFDELSPIYTAVVDQHRDVKGCWRALQTSEDYMLKSVFPELLQGEPAPEDDDVWEISRFAVRKGDSEKEKGNFSDVTLDLVKSFYDLATEHNIKSYVTVTTVACERLLRQLGVTLRRMGEGKSMQIGVERSVALWIDVNENLNIVRH